MKNRGLCVGLIFVAALTGCANSQATGAADHSASGPPVSAPPSPQTVQTPSPEEAAQANLNQADSACQAYFPSQRGHFYQQKVCVFQAYAKYIFPTQNDDQKLIEQQEEGNLLEAARKVDNGLMSLQDYDSYHLISHKIMNRELQQAAESDIRRGQEAMLQAQANYDTEHGDQDSLANETRDLAILGLEDEQQALSNDRDSYEYCAGLNSKNLSACNPEKIAFQTDLATYQAMASSVPQGPQSVSQTATESLRQEDIQDDLDAIAGGVVP